MKSLISLITFLLLAVSGRTQCNLSFNWCTNSSNTIALENTSSTTNTVFQVVQYGQTHVYTTQTTSAFLSPGPAQVCVISLDSNCYQQQYCETINFDPNQTTSNYQTSFSYIDLGNGVIEFTNQSTSTTGSFNWNFGDGNFGYGATTVTNTYTQPGWYAVCLSTTNACFVNNYSTCDSIYVSPFTTVPSQTSFDYTIDGYTINVNNTSTADSSQWQGQWFIDNNYSVEYNPSFTVNGPGTYVLCVSNYGYCPGAFPTQCDTIVIADTTTVIPSDSCALSFDVLVNGMDVTITNTSTVDFSPQHVWEFDFGDGATNTTDTDFTYTYTQEGTYTICLTATSCVCTSQIYNFCETVTVAEQADTCEVDFDFTIRANGFVSFTNSSGAGFNDGYYFNWDFGDGFVSTTEWNPSHVYSNPGTYTACFQAVSCYCPGQLFEVCYDIVIDDPCADPNITVQKDSCGVYSVASDNSLGGIPCWYIDGQTVSIGSQTETLTFTQNGTYIISYNLVGNSCPDYSWYDTLVVDCFLDCTDPVISVTEDSCGIYSVMSSNTLGGTPCWYIDGQLFSIGNEAETLNFTQNGTYLISYNLIGTGCPSFTWYDTLIIDCFSTVQDSLACWLNYTYTAIDSCTFEFIGIPMNPNSTVTWLINGVSYPGSTLIHTFQSSGAHQVLVQVFNPITGCNETYFVDVITTACSLNNPNGGGNNPILNLNTNAFNFGRKQRIATNLYPNPASQYFTFEAFKSLKIYDNYGRLILISTSNRAAVQDLSAGEYIVKGFDEDGFVEAKKLIVKH